VRGKGVGGGCVLSEEIIVLGIEFDIVFLDVLEQFICSEDFGDFDELVVIIVAVEEGFFAEYHGCEHCSETPHVQGVV